MVRPAGLEPDDPRSVADAVAEAVVYQRKLRCTVVTDGDFPREDFRGGVLDGVTGFHRTDERDADGLVRWVAQSLPKADGPLLADRAARLTELTLIAPKVSLPSPAYLAATTYRPGAAVPSARELGEALAEIVRAEIALLVAGGVRLIQLNNPLLLGQVGTDPVPGGALSFEDALAVDAMAVRLDERPEGVRIGVAPGWAAPAAVDRARAERMYAGLPADRWVLPFD
ncbi:methionine synthase II (cobalamin-independent)-like protein, partial [Streptomyces sp. TRM76130]|nr:methionine synthase II (cobalamin-independent)-like protein [Streptomyces sp. TRM76130]